MVIVVAAVLAFTALSLKPLQDKNIEIDKKMQILKSVHIVATAVDAQKLYSQFITKSYLIDANGTEVAGNPEAIDLKIEVKKAVEKRKLIIYECKTADGATKYILPVYGAGLWGPIWGYIAVNDDKNSVFGTYFSHKSETPGLGAEIDKEPFQKQFESKHLLQNDKFASIGVMKAGQTAQNQDQVDAISGGTITSKAVEKMLKDCLSAYEKFLTAKK